jgi:PAS domain S-box-containing protein
MQSPVHLAAALPPDEEERLRALRALEILDTAPETSFDRITAAAARIFRVPVAIVSLVDRDRQWFKSIVGLPIVETSRDVSFCAHALLTPDEVTVVPDAALDARFADNPLVTGAPGIRFYAGAPLRTAAGFALGSLCVIDTVPRDVFSEEERATLADLAAVIVEMLGLRQAIQRAGAQDAARERKPAQGELEISHNLLRAIIDGTDDAVFIKDRDCRYLLMNPAGADFFGCAPAEIIGRSDYDFFLPEAARRTCEHDREVMETGQSRTYENADLIAGKPRVFLTTKNPYRDADGNLLGVIGIARDVSRQRRDAEALREAKEEAERANHAKSDFLSRMSHELRTPLNAILGFGQLLEIGELGPKQHDAVGHILRAGRHLLALIDEVLAISRIEAGRMELSLEPVGVSEITGECLSLISRQAADRGISCRDCCSGEPTDGHVLADRQRLRQVVLNFLSNAVKYNREGGQVILSCKEAPGLERDEPRRLRIGVSDTGGGLRPEEIERLFVPFERLGAERSSIEGTGLGLALSKGLVEAMGGRMGVESVLGQGSTFWVELPQAENPLKRLQRQVKAPDDPDATADEFPCRGTVLYIEDNLSNLQLIECVFESRPGVELLSVQQGTLGLEVAAARQPGLILLDLHLPDLPGWEVVVRLRDNPRTAAIPLVIISADATAGQINRLRAIGVVDYLMKPIDVAKLLALIDEHLCRSPELAVV